jgi:hypothetical protein
VQAAGSGPPVQAGEHGTGGTVRHGQVQLKGTGGTVRHQLGRLLLIDPARQVSAQPGRLSCQELTHLCKNMKLNMVEIVTDYRILQHTGRHEITRKNVNQLLLKAEEEYQSKAADPNPGSCLMQLWIQTLELRF